MPKLEPSPRRIERLRTLATVGVLVGSLASARADPVPPEPQEAGREVGLFPLIGGDTDNGFGLGAIGTIAMFDAGNPIYRWKLDFSGFYATKAVVPSPSYVDLATTLTIPQLLDDHLRLEIRPSITFDDALKFYGLGNQPHVPVNNLPDRDFYQRFHPSLSVLTRWRLSANWFLLGGAQITYDKIMAEAASTLVRELGPTDPDLLRAHGVFRVETGVVYDSRDNELAPNSGQYHQLKVRASPRLGPELPYGYQQLGAIARVYKTLVPRRLVLAARVVLDLQTGNVPFYEESRYEETSAIGGGLGVRGVPAYAFYGRAKAFGNLELRAKIWHFEAWSRPFSFGVAGFVDAGRLWTDLGAAQPGLDGTGLGLHYGIGGGIRIQEGRAFLVRADLAWSPDARPVGAYLMADQAF